MNAGALVHVLLDEAEDFDARAYLMQSSLEGTAKRLEMEWLGPGWPVWYKQVGPWHIYVDPYNTRPLMELEVGYEFAVEGEIDQRPIFKKVVSQQDADEILPKVMAVIQQIETFQGKDTRPIEQALGAALQNFRPMESQEFDARDYFLDMELPGMKVADALGFDCRTEPSCSPKKVIGQWIVYITPGSNYNLVNVYRDYGWQSEAKGQWYLDDANVERVLTEVVRVLQAHTDEHGWAQDEKEAYRKLGAIPQKQ